MFTHGEKMILLSAIALDATVTKEQTKCASLVLRKIAEERLRILATLTDKVMADVTPTIPRLLHPRRSHGGILRRQP